MVGALQELQLSAIDNAELHWAYLPDDVMEQPGVLDRIIEPVLPFLAHDRDTRRGLLSAVRRFDPSIERDKSEIGIRLHGMRTKLVGEPSIIEYALRASPIEAGKRISDDVVFREQYLSNQLGTKVRVLTALGDLAMFTGLGFNFSGLSEEFLTLDYRVVKLPDGEFEIRMAQHSYDTPFIEYVNHTFPFEGGIEAGGVLLFSGDESPCLRIHETYFNMTEEETLSTLERAFGFLDIDKRNLRFEFPDEAEARSPT